MIRFADINDFDIIKNITASTIKSVYPHYYPIGAVEYFLKYHSDENIRNDIVNRRCFLFIDNNGDAVGTVTVKDNEINRLFVMPQYQKKGYGKALLDFAENKIADKFNKIVIAASFPAKNIYLKRGYRETAYNTIHTENGDFLCYDEMIKNI